MGAPKFPTQKTNHQNAIEGIILIKPLLTENLRDPLRSKITPDRKNNAEEHSPWATHM